MAINHFDNHMEAFLEASKIIHQHCITFAGRRITAPLSAWAYTVLGRTFSHCDPAATAYNFDCTMWEGGKYIHCIAEVSTEGRVRFIIPQH